MIPFVVRVGSYTYHHQELHVQIGIVVMKFHGGRTINIALESLVERPGLYE